MFEYNPSTVDIEKVTLEYEQNKLVELLAKDRHDRWAMRLYKNGWRFGDESSVVRKTHPCLMPFDELPVMLQMEKLNSSETIIRQIIALGYKITKDNDN